MKSIFNINEQLQNSINKINDLGIKNKKNKNNIYVLIKFLHFNT